MPILLWFASYAALLYFFVPRMRERSKVSSIARSTLMGRIVDSYTNILTVKLFARASEEDRYVRNAVDQHIDLFKAAQRLLTAFASILDVLNALLIAGSGALALMLWRYGKVEVGAIAMVLPLTLQLTNMSRQIAMRITEIFEDVGVVQEGMLTIAQPLQLPDPADAKPLTVGAGRIEFKNVNFGYGRDVGVLQNFNLTIAPGEKIGLVGRSGAGKSTVVNLLLRFFDLEDGAILIDGQDIADLTQESLRSQISVVTQDTSLLHRSIRANIRYGRPTAGIEEIERAAKLAHAHDFILDLEDWQGRRGYDAHVGERGVKLSGGQRQRVAIARVILKDAPILVFDEATSALDSEVEAAIQSSLGTLMAGKTVIAIAHRLSTIAQMDRLVVLEHGRIIEQGSHRELLAHERPLRGAVAAPGRRLHRCGGDAGGGIRPALLSPISLAPIPRYARLSTGRQPRSVTTILGGGNERSRRIAAAGREPAGLGHQGARARPIRHRRQPACRSGPVQQRGRSAGHGAAPLRPAILWRRRARAAAARQTGKERIEHTPEQTLSTIGRTREVHSANRL